MEVPGESVEYQIHSANNALVAVWIIHCILIFDESGLPKFLATTLVASPPDNFLFRIAALTGIYF